MLTCPVAPVLSMRAAMFTVSPQRSYWNLVSPTIPATTAPVCTPARMANAGSPLALRSATWRTMYFCISKAASTVSRALPARGSGKPPAHM